MESLAFAFVDASTPFNYREVVKAVLLAPVACIRVFTCLCVVWLNKMMYTHKMIGVIDNTILLSIYLVRLSVGFYYVPVKGLENLREAYDVGAVVIYNHISFMDSMILMRDMVFSMVTTTAYEHNALIGWYFQYTDAIFVNAKEKSTTQRIVERIKDNSTKHMVAIAPEGTFSNGHVLLKFKSGAFVAKVPVLPTLLRYPNKCVNPTWISRTALSTCYRVLTQFVNYATLEYLPVIYPVESETAQEYADRTRKIMAAALGVPMVEYDLSDKLRFIESLKSKKHAD